VTQEVEQLPSKHKALSSNPQYRKIKIKKISKNSRDCIPIDESGSYSSLEAPVSDIT
jgi:hypothetical protein